MALNFSNPAGLASKNTWLKGAVAQATTALAQHLFPVVPDGGTTSCDGLGCSTGARHRFSRRVSRQARLLQHTCYGAAAGSSSIARRVICLICGATQAATLPQGKGRAL